MILYRILFPYRSLCEKLKVDYDKEGLIIEILWWYGLDKIIAHLLHIL